MGKELRRGTVRHVTMRAECEAKAWRSVAYFSLDGQPARLVCQALPAYSRTPLPPPFSVGDPMVIIGKLNPKEGRVEVACARLIRQGKTIDADYTKESIIFGMFLIIVPVVIAMIFSSSASHANRLGNAAALTIPFIAIGVWVLSIGYERFKACRLVEDAASKFGRDTGTTW